MNDTDSKSNEMAQMSENKTDEKERICAFCWNKSELEKRFITCVAEPQVSTYENAKKVISTMKTHKIKVDLKIWDLFLCPSCMLDNRNRAFTRESRSMSKLFWGGLFGIVGIPSLSYILITDSPDVYGTGIKYIILIPLILLWIISLGMAIISPLQYFLNKSDHKEFILNKNINKEEDKIKAFTEAGERILESLQLEKEGSLFRHFPLPKLPTDEDFSKMFPNKYVEYDDYIPKMKILYVTNDKKYAIPNEWEKTSIISS